MEIKYVIHIVILIIFGIIEDVLVRKEVLRLSDKRFKTPMEHLNIGEFNRGQSSKLIRGLVEEDKTAFIQKNGKPIAVVMSYERYQRMFEQGLDINDF